MTLPVKLLALTAIFLMAVQTTARADEISLTYGSAKPDTAYYEMGQQIADAVKTGSNGEIVLTVEQSEGPVQNVTAVKEKGADYVFSSHPVLIQLAQEGKAMFADAGNGRFDDIRALFPIPSLTMQFVMAQESAVLKLSQLEGKKLLVDNGTFASREAAKYIKLFGLDGKVTLVDADLSDADKMLKDKKIDGYVVAGSWPTPSVVETATTMAVNLITMDGEEITKTKRTRMVIPSGTYDRQETDIATTSLPVVVYTTKQMDEDTAYRLTKTFWEQTKNMSESAAWWKGVDDQLMVNINSEIHPGAIKYYKEVGFPIAGDQK